MFRIARFCTNFLKIFLGEDPPIFRVFLTRLWFVPLGGQHYLPPPFLLKSKKKSGPPLFWNPGSATAHKTVHSFEAGSGNQAYRSGVGPILSVVSVVVSGIGRGLVVQSAVWSAGRTRVGREERDLSVGASGIQRFLGKSLWSLKKGSSKKLISICFFYHQNSIFSVSLTMF